MSIKSWFAAKVSNRIMDEADKELAFLREHLLGDPAAQQRFLEHVTQVKDSIPELTGFWHGARGQWAEHATLLIARLDEAHRFVLAQRLMEVSVKTMRVDVAAASAIKVVSTWMKLVEIRDVPSPSYSAQNKFRAASLLTAFEAEVNRTIANMEKEA